MYLRYEVRTPVEARQAVSPTHTPAEWILRLLPGVNWPGPGAELPSPFSVKFKNEWSYTSTLPTVPSLHVTGTPFTNYKAPNYAVFLSGLINNLSKSKYNSLETSTYILYRVKQKLQFLELWVTVNFVQQLRHNYR
jgi:hypothetical protein